MLAASAPAAAASPSDLALLIIRAGSGDWTAWQGTGKNNAPAIQFNQSGTGTSTEVASIVFTPTSGAGNAPKPTALFNSVDGLSVNAAATGVRASHIYTVSVPLTGTQTKSVFIRAAAKADGTYAVSWASLTATFAIQGAGTTSRLVKTPA